MVILEYGNTWTVTIGNDLRVRCANTRLREWAQAVIDSDEPTDYIPDLSVYHAHRLAAFPGWKIKRVTTLPEDNARGVVY